MKNILMVLILVISTTSFAYEKNLNGEMYPEPIPTYLQLRTFINSSTECKDYFGNLANDLLQAKNAVGHAGIDIFFNSSVGSEYEKDFNEAEIRLSRVYKTLETLFSKAIDCHSTSGQIKVTPHEPRTVVPPHEPRTVVPPHEPGTVCYAPTAWCWLKYWQPPGTDCRCGGESGVAG
jgi:hypothetical protein